MIKNYLTRTCIIILAIIAITSFFNGCSKSGDSPGPNNNSSSLTITALNVNAGPYTTQVVLTGTGFSTTAANNHVSFNGKAAVVQAATSTHLLTSAPLAAGTGNVTITVNGATATGPTFTYQATRVVTTFAGGNKTGADDGSGTAATFFQPDGIAVDGAGNLYVADQGNFLVRKITPAGLVSTLAGSGTNASTDGTGSSASFGTLTGIAVDGTGNIYVSDLGNNSIREITPAGVVTTLAGNGGRQPVDGTGKAAGFGGPRGLVTDGSGNIFVADQGAGLVRKVTSSGVVTTIYGTGNSSVDAYGITLDKTGNIYITNLNANSIDKITQGGVMSVFAGNSNITGGDLDGPGTAAAFHNPYGLTTDAIGSIFVTDKDNGKIRMITPAAAVTTVAGPGSGSAFDGPVATATIVSPLGITVDSAGNIYFIDGNSVREISVQ